MHQLHTPPHPTYLPYQAALHMHAADLTLGPDALTELDGPALTALIARHHARHHPAQPLPPHCTALQQQIEGSSCSSCSSSRSSSSSGGVKLTIAEEAEAVRREVEVVKLALMGANARLFLHDLLQWPGVLAAVRAAGGFGPLEEAAGLLVRHGRGDGHGGGGGAGVCAEQELEEDLHLGVFEDVEGAWWWEKGGLGFGVLVVFG